MIERKITAALQADTAHVRLSMDLSDRIKREAAKQHRRSWWSGWIQGKASKVAVAAIALLLMVGAGREIFLASPSPTSPFERTYQSVAVSDLSSAAGFTVKTPGYVPAGLPLFDSRLAGDSSGGDAQLRVVEIIYMQAGGGTGIMVQQWKADEAAAFPPGDSHGEVLGSAPYHKAIRSESVDVNGASGTTLTYILSGQTVNRVYWNVDGVAYAVSAMNSLPVHELLKTARSLR